MFYLPIFFKSVGCNSEVMEKVVDLNCILFFSFTNGWKYICRVISKFLVYLLH